jgi:hypothetical protein
LTPAARKLTDDFLALRKRMILMVGKEFDKRFRQSVIPEARRS